MTAKQIIKDKDIEDLLITALEGGSNYWYFLPNGEWNEYQGKNHPMSDCQSVQIYLAAIDGKAIRVTDVETMEEGDNPEDDFEGDYLGDISKANFERAEDLLIEKYPHVLANIISENYDANDADVWFQLVVMGEVVYG